jgi:hypothetical protein
MSAACSKEQTVDPDAQYDTHAGPLEFWCKKTTESSFASHIGDVSAIRKDGDSYWLTFVGQMDEAGRPDFQQLKWTPKILGYSDCWTESTRVKAKIAGKDTGDVF